MNEMDAPGRIPLLHLSEEQVRCLISPARKQILNTLIREGPVSVKRLAEAVGTSEQSTYYQSRVMLECGLLRLAGTEGEGRTAERLLDAAAERYRLPEGESEAVLKSNLSLIRMLGRQYQAAEQRGSEIAVVRTSFRAGREVRREVERRIQEAIDYGRAHSDPSGEVVNATVFLISQ